MEEKEVWLLRLLKKAYQPMVDRVVCHPLLTAIAALGLVVISVPIAALISGPEFMPRLDEGDILIEGARLPRATLEDSLAMSTQVEKILKQFPEVKTVFCKTGRPEIANDVMGVQQTDVWVMLRPEESWPQHKSRDELVGEISEKLNDQVPGATFAFTQPIQMRVDELVAGVKANVAVLLYGDDLKILAEKSKEIERVLRDIPGAVDVKADYQANTPTLTIRTRPDQLARFGIAAQDVMDTVSAIGGHEVGRVFEGRARYPILVRFPKEWREDSERLKQLPVQSQGGRIIPLQEVADIVLEESQPGIEHEAIRRRTFVQCNVRGRDVASFVNEAQNAVGDKVKLPPGYTLRWGGDFENLQSASLRLAIITPCGFAGHLATPVHEP